MQSWEVQVDGTTHTIQYKRGKVIIDNEVHKVKSSNWFIYLIDYAIDFGNTDCKLVVIGNKADLAVNGTFLGSGKPYVPVSSAPAWTWVLVGISIIGGWFLCGVIGILIGVVMSMLIVRMALEKKTGPAIGAFVGCMAIEVAVMMIVAALYVGAGLS